MDVLAQDLRYAVRSMRSTPGFTAIVVLTLALGIGVNTALFSVINEMLLRPLAIFEPERVVAVYTSDYSSGPFGSSSVANFRDFRDQSRTLSGLAAFDQGFVVSLRTAEETSRVTAGLASGEYFEVLGVHAHRGRLFTTADTEPDAPPIAVLSYDFWQKSFAGRDDALGRKITLNGNPLTVAGVTPPGFRGTQMGRVPEVWVPLSQAEIRYPGFGARLLNRRGSRWLSLVGRLADGFTVEQAHAEMNAIMARLAEEYPESNLGTLQQPDKPRPMTVRPVSEETLGGGGRDDAARRARLLMAVVGLVLLTACANVANLVLAKGHRRQREMAVRLALGAPRGRLARQPLTESLLTSLLGGAVGLLLALAMGRVLLSLGLTAAISRAAVVPQLRLDATVLLFALGASLVTGLVFGLVPALRATRPNLVPALKSGNTHYDTRAGRFPGKDLLVIAQVAGSVVLLIGAGLFGRSLQKAYAVELGFDTENVLLASFDLGSQGLDPDQQRNFYAELRRRVEGLPGVEAAGVARVVPVSAAGSRSTIRVEGYQPPDGEDMELNMNSVTPGYFQALGISLLSGRGFTEADDAEAPQVAVVNQAFVEHFWTGQNPLGKRIYGFREDSPPIEVVGVTATGKYRNLREDPMPYVYYPMAQRTRDGGTLALRTRMPPLGLAGPVREVARSLQPSLPVFDVRTLEEHQGLALAQERNIAILVSLLGFLALLIAALGVYGVMSNAVTRRTRELGIRSALGARLFDIAGMVLGHAVRLALAGAAAGALLAFLNRGLVADLLFEVRATDPRTFLAAGALLVSVAVVASLPPAWRAARVDPLVAVRDE